MTATTTIKDEMLAYFSRLNRNEQQSVLGLIKTFVDSREEMRAQTLQEYNDELEKGNAEIEAGNFVTHDEVKKCFQKKYENNNSLETRSCQTICICDQIY